MILLCHDKHEPPEKRKASKDAKGSGKPTPKSWYKELAERGGRVIEIAQGEPLEVVGMLIQHRPHMAAMVRTIRGGCLYSSDRH